MKFTMERNDKESPGTITFSGQITHADMRATPLDDRDQQMLAVPTGAPVSEHLLALSHFWLRWEQAREAEDRAKAAKNEEA